MIKKKIVIKGPKVQDVGYRPFLLNVADTEDIPRFDVRNKNDTDSDGNQIVEVFIGGDSDAIDRFVEFINLGIISENKDNRPENAVVKSADIVDNDYKGNIRTTESFSRWLSNNQLYKMTSIGGKMLEKQDKMLGKLDESREEIVGEIRNLRSDLMSYFDKRFVKLEEDVNRIKMKMHL